MREKEEIVITSVSEFLKEVLEIQDSSESKIYFRGHRNREWKLQPYILRKDGWVKDEHILIRRLYAHNPSEFSDCSTTLDMLVKMQHYGLPTRLLDITTNPLVALYFACEPFQEKEDGEVIALTISEKFTKYSDSDVVSAVANIAKCQYDHVEINLFSDFVEHIEENSSEKKEDASFLEGLMEKIQDSEYEFSDDNLKEFNDELGYLHHQIGNEKPHYKHIIQPYHLGKSWVVMPKLNNQRIINQQGAFILFGLGIKQGSEKDTFSYTKDGVTKIPDKWIAKRIYISHEYKSKIIGELSKLGISKSYIYPEMEKYSEELKNELEHHEDVQNKDIQERVS